MTEEVETQNELDKFRNKKFREKLDSAMKGQESYLTQLEGILKEKQEEIK